MKTWAQHIIRVATAALCAVTALAAPPLKPTGRVVEREVLIKLKADAPAAVMKEIRSAADSDTSDRLTKLRSGEIWRVHSRSKNVDALTKALSNNPNIEFVEPDQILELTATPNDASYAQLWGLKNTGQAIAGTYGLAGDDISAEAAWSVTTGSSSVVVGVVDTGIDYTHPDLAANMWSNPGGKGNALCASGTHGFNAITKTCDPKDDHYHGTHVAGTIGAVGNNGVGVVGVNWSVSLMALKFLNSQGYGSTGDAIAAIDFAVQAKIDGVNVRVLSNSWGGGAFSKALLAEINKANENDILFVAAAGNSGNNSDYSANYPSSYATDNMISVAATDNRDGIAYFSNWGPTTVHLGAPGVDVYSTTPNGAYAYLSGTSMAAPHVSGVAALLLAKDPSLTTAQVKKAILDNTDPIASMQGKTITGGRLNAARALGAPETADFRLSVSPASQSVMKGTDAQYIVTVNPLNGFSGTVDLSVVGLPSGVSASFSPASTTSTSTLTISTTDVYYTGPYNVTISGTSGGVTRATLAALTITPSPGALVLTCPSFTLEYGVYYYLSLYSSSAAGAALGDTNGDGRPDLILVSPTSNVVSVARAFGSAFDGPASYTVGRAPLAVAFADLNGDGIGDIVTANSGSNSVSVLLGTTGGSFDSATSYGVGSSPFSIEIADVNGDGKLDLVTANNASGNISIVPGSGDGTFGSASNYPTASGPSATTSADFDSDGKLDIAVTNYNAGTVSLLRGLGSGNFASPINYAVGTEPTSLVASDLNRDGRLDLAVANYGSNNVSVLLQNTNGTFAAAANQSLGNGAGPSSVTVTDVDHDGISDLVVADTDSDTLSILLGSPDGTYSLTLSPPVADSPMQVIPSDLNRDGRTDLIVAGMGYTGIMYDNAICKVGCGVLTSASAIAAGSAPSSVAAADFNRDGRIDVAVANRVSNNVTISLGNGNRTFQSPMAYGVGSAPASLVTGDFNRDGALDVAVANEDAANVSVLLSDHVGGFQSAINTSCGANPTALTTADINRDGALDLAVASSASNSVSILFGNADGTFQSTATYAVGASPSAIVAADFNRDGRTDVAVANAASNDVSILLANADATFLRGSTLSVGNTPDAMAAADFNRDGKVDLVVANTASNDLSVLLGMSGGLFRSATTYAAGSSPSGIAIADFTNDSNLDLMVAQRGSNSIALLRGNGNGTFGSASVFPAGVAPVSVATGDFDGDGQPDVAVANSGDGSVSPLFDSCPAPDLTVAVTHSGSFAQGGSNGTFTITVRNDGMGATFGTVSLTDTLPTGLRSISMSGNGWSCASTTCSRSDVLSAGSSYPTITLTVSIAGNTPASVVNTVNVSGGSEVNTANDTANDTVSVVQVPDLVISARHEGTFSAGDVGRIYRITVRNSGGGATAGTVTATLSVPSALTVTSLSGTGWNCNASSRICTRNDTLSGGAAFPDITLQVNVASTAPSMFSLIANVSGGGESNTVNDTAIDDTTLWGKNACGSFGAPTFLQGSYSTSQVETADLNGDGFLDLVSLGYQSVSVHVGKGDGSFLPAVSYPVSYYASTVRLRDVNHDSKIDIVVMQNAYNNASIAVLPGAGDGTFGAAVVSTIPRSGYFVMADFNGDSYPDVAVQGYPSVDVLIGSGTGTFAYLNSYAQGYNIGGLATGDLNKDGVADLIAVESYSGFVALIGNGDGSFSASPVHSLSSYYSGGAQLSDINGDGNADLLLNGYYYSNVMMFLGDGAGGFGPESDLSLGFTPSALTVQDINGDGKVDLIATGYNNIGTAFGNGDGSFQTASAFSTSIVNGPTISIADFNGDGTADLAGPSYSGAAVFLGGCTDLTITKSHYGNFIGMQPGVYRIFVTAKKASSRGTVTVTDLLPAPLTVASMSGYGWDCDVNKLTCTRDSAVGAETSFPEIAVVVNVPGGDALTVTNTAFVSAISDANSENNTASDPTTITQQPDLAVTSTHVGAFAAGDVGRTYTIIVGNVGGAATSGTVAVHDTLSAGLTATAISGNGWTCTLAPLDCSRIDSLAPSADFPPIMLTVDVSRSLSESATNYTNVNVTNDAGWFNNTTYDVTTIIPIVPRVVANASTNAQVDVSWGSVANAKRYDILRSSNNSNFAVIASTVAPNYTDTTVAPNTAYVYAVRASDGTTNGNLSTYDFATTMRFTDDPIFPRTTIALAQHLQELRTGVNLIRAAAGLPAATFTDSSLQGVPIRAVHILELRTKLDEARTAVGIPLISYTDPGLPAGTFMKAAHFTELRLGIK